MDDRISTHQAEAIYGIPADAIAQLCREERLPGAKKVRGRWQVTRQAMEELIAEYPSWRSPDPDTDDPGKGTFHAIGFLLGFVVDIIAVFALIQRAGDTLLWAIIITITLLLWLTSLMILFSKRKVGIPNGQVGDKKLYKTRPRYRYNLLRRVAWIVTLGLPISLALGAIGYYTWSALPQDRTVVLVAKFVAPDGSDDADVTDRLIQGMKDTLRKYPKIVIKPLDRPIPTIGGSELAQRIGRQPWHKATFVVWGDYTGPPDREMNVHFDVLTAKNRPIQDFPLVEEYGPKQIGQLYAPYNFKFGLVEHVSQLVAFSSWSCLVRRGRIRGSTFATRGRRISRQDISSGNAASD